MKEVPLKGDIPLTTTFVCKVNFQLVMTSERLFIFWRDEPKIMFEGKTKKLDLWHYVRNKDDERITTATVL